MISKYGNLTSFPEELIDLSSRPKFLIHNLKISIKIIYPTSMYLKYLPNVISSNYSYKPPLRNATLYLEYPENNSSAPNPLNITFALDFTNLPVSLIILYIYIYI